MTKKHAVSRCCSIAIAALGVSAVSAATFFVDFADGDNAADGRTAQTAWKHAPGDAEATGTPALTVLAAGDTVVFKGGVTYHGSIRLNSSGAEGDRITLDGNTAGTFGQGRAIIDGGRIIDTWQRCRSAEDAAGNPRWKDLFYADIALDIASNFEHGEVVAHRQVGRDKMAPWQRVILYDGDRRLLPISQHPKPTDSFYPDLPRDFLQSSSPLEVRAAEGLTLLTDEERLVHPDPDHYRGMILGVHGGNNHVYFASVTGYDPAAHQLKFAEFKPSTYPTTKYALYNSVKLIENPGEWAVAPLGQGRTRFYLLPEHLENGLPSNIGFPVYETGVAVVDGASHIAIRGFMIQRFSGGAGGISVGRSSRRSRDVFISGCEIRFVSGHAGIGPNYCDEIVIEDCYIHHCPSWTSGIFLNRVNDYVVRNCRLDKNSGSGIRHYECKRGRIHDNAILNHYGMHSSTINVYEGCADIVIERNYMHNTVAINRNAENIAFRHNVVDGQGRAAVNVAMWTSGRVGGTAIRNIQFENNTFVNANRNQNWSTGIFVQTGRGASSPQGLVIRNNVLDRLRPPVPGTVENNIFLRETEASVAGSGGAVETDPKVLFRDPENGDFRRLPGGPLPDAGADLPPPPAAWRKVAVP